MLMNGPSRMAVLTLLVVCAGATAVTNSNASTVKKRNIGDLIAMGELIVFGKVLEVHDGFDQNNVPYTEVTVEVQQTAKGEAGRTYTFRQFGLIKPRDMGNGLVNLNVTPDGWPTYSQGEEVALFLYKAASRTGLRTTVGLFQGKFRIEDGQVTNSIDNEGLFENLHVDLRKLSEKEREMIRMNRGRIPVQVFTSFVSKAAQEHWFEPTFEEGR